MIATLVQIVLIDPAVYSRILRVPGIYCMTTKKLFAISVEPVRDKYRTPIASGIRRRRTQHYPGIASGDLYEYLAPGA